MPPYSSLHPYSYTKPPSQWRKPDYVVYDTASTVWEKKISAAYGWPVYVEANTQNNMYIQILQWDQPPTGTTKDASETIKLRGNLTHAFIVPETWFLFVLNSGEYSLEAWELR